MIHMMSGQSSPDSAASKSSQPKRVFRSGGPGLENGHLYASSGSLRPNGSQTQLAVPSITVTGDPNFGYHHNRHHHYPISLPSTPSDSGRPDALRPSGMSRASLRTPQGPTYRKFLTLNVSGYRFLVPVEVAENRRAGLLTVFVEANHETRLIICNGFFEHSQEYFFARYVFRRWPLHSVAGRRQSSNRSSATT